MDKKHKIMVALGGNALGSTPAEQRELVRITASAIADLVEEGNEVVVAHGNGPQVGMINLGFSEAFAAGKIKSDMPFPECGAMSQGYIGYHLQNALSEEFAKRGTSIPAATIVTQVVVDENDPAFKDPAKPIGAFYSKQQAAELSAASGDTYKEDAGRGYRKVVASPKPVDVVEKDSIRLLSESGTVVIAAGGGGIPVARIGGKLVGKDAVVDKDFASEKLAEILDCDTLLILTAVEKVAINFGKPGQKWLSEISTSEALEYKKQGQFAPGSMLPKVEAASLFANSKAGRRSIITSLDKALDGLAKKTGTCIVSLQ